MTDEKGCERCASGILDIYKALAKQRAEFKEKVREKILSRCHEQAHARNRGRPYLCDGCWQTRKEIEAIFDE